MEDEGDAAPQAHAAFRLPATAPVIYFEELSEMLPACVAYEHQDDFWWNLGYIHDKMHLDLEGQAQAFPKFTQSLSNKLQEVAPRLGPCVYMRPGPGSERTWVLKANVGLFSGCKFVKPHKT